MQLSVFHSAESLNLHYSGGDNSNLATKLNKFFASLFAMSASHPSRKKDNQNNNNNHLIHGTII
jgi:hypothetical protein